MKTPRDVYLWQNGNVMTFDADGQQIAELQGRHTPELESLIREAADEKTVYYGFDGIACQWPTPEIVVGPVIEHTERSESTTLVAVGCRSCPASIIWTRTEKGRPMPLDAEPVEFGGNVVIRGGVAVVLAKGEASLPGEKRYKSHWATCPAAANFRKPASTDAAKTKAGKRSTRKPAKTDPNLFGEE